MSFEKRIEALEKNVALLEEQLIMLKKKKFDRVIQSSNAVSKRINFVGKITVT